MNKTKMAAELVKLARSIVGKELRIDQSDVEYAVDLVMYDEVAVNGKFGVYVNISGSYYPQTLYSPAEGPELETMFKKWLKEPYTDPSKMSAKEFMLLTARQYADNNRVPMSPEELAQTDDFRKAVAKALAKGTNQVICTFQWEAIDGNTDGQGEFMIEDDEAPLTVHGKLSGSSVSFYVKSDRKTEDKLSEILYESDEFDY